MRYIRFFKKLWKSTSNRIIACVCILLLLLSVISDSSKNENLMLTDCLLGLGVGGGAIFLGMNMMRLLPEDPRFHRDWRGQAALLIAGGGIFLYTALNHCSSLCFFQ